MKETRTARVHLGPDGLVRVVVAAHIIQAPADAEANIAAAAAATGGRPCPVLVDIRLSEPLSPETRRLYSGRRLTDSFTALGLLVQANPVGRMLGNIYFRIAKPAIPIKLFERENAAISWLQEHL